MKKIFNFLNTSFSKSLLTLLFLFVLMISCSKDHSVLNPPPPHPVPPVEPPVITTVTIFTTQSPSGHSENDSMGGIELGVKFRSAVDGKIAGIKFYKAPGNIGTHIGQLYSSGGTLLASEEFKNETDSGWQSVLFTSEIPITANTTYIAAYHSSLGYYIGTHSGLKTAITNGPLTALADSTDGRNGLYKYTNTPALPDSSFMSNNYWVDVIEKY